MIDAVALMGADVGTPCSGLQELSVLPSATSPFLAGDTDEGGWNPRRMPRILTQEEQGATAFRRLRELLDDMGWDDEWAIDQFVREIGEPLGLRAPDKAIGQWFERQSIPSHQVFNMGEVLGIAPGWFTEQTHLSKTEAIAKGGLYDREITREARRKRA